jgi:hypothetical protein
MIVEAADIANNSNVELGLVLLVGGMIVALVRLLSRAEHNQDAHKSAIEEIKKCQAQHQLAQQQAAQLQQQQNESFNLRLDRIERPPEIHAARTGRFAAIPLDDRDRG